MMSQKYLSRASVLGPFGSLQLPGSIYPDLLVTMEEYTAGGVLGLLGKKKCKKTEASQLFTQDEKTEDTVRQSLEARLEKLNNLAENIQKSSSKKKRKLKDAVYSREASLREADQPKTKKKKKEKKKVETAEEEEKEEEEEAVEPTAKSSGKRVDRTSQRENRKLKKTKLGKDRKTVFVGNLPVSATKKTLRNIFKEFGKIDSIRFRSAAPADLKLPKKATVIKKEFHEKRNNINAYVVFEEKESVAKALSANGTLVEDLHIRVDKVAAGKDTKKQPNSKLSVFVGNLPFDVEEEAVREHFEDCGDIEGVRIIRDRQTGLGKGFGFVLFKDIGAVGLALRLHQKKFSGRLLRVVRATQAGAKNEGKEKMEKSKKSGPGHPAKMRMPTNVSSSSYQGLKAQKLTKIKKKLKHKKKLNLKGKKTIDNDAKKPKNSEKKPKNTEKSPKKTKDSGNKPMKKHIKFS